MSIRPLYTVLVLPIDFHRIRKVTIRAIMKLRTGMNQSEHFSNSLQYHSEKKTFELMQMVLPRNKRLWICVSEPSPTQSIYVNVSFRLIHDYLRVSPLISLVIGTSKAYLMVACIFYSHITNLSFFVIVHKTLFY